MKTDIKNLWLWEQVIKPLISTKWLERLSSFNQLIVGYSGGLDSTVLLHALASHESFLPKLMAVHVNHGISKKAIIWERHCQQFCFNFGIHFISQKVHFDRKANIEEGARNARYSVFSSLISEQRCLLLGHHIDDQAETLLLQLFRGAGIDGLAAMPEFSQFGRGQLARPFLAHTRDQLYNYADLHQLFWVEDESNQDVNYSRNYLRQEIMPLIKKKWPGVSKNIARTAMHCQQAKRNLKVLAAIDLAKEQRVLEQNHDGSPSHDDSISFFSFKKEDVTILLLEPLKEFNFDRIVNILRAWIKRNNVKPPSMATFHRIIEEVIRARKDAVPQVSWGEVVVRRYHHCLFLDKKSEIKLPSCMEWLEFPVPLNLEHNKTLLLARKTNQGGVALPLGAKIKVKFRQGGEKFTWHGQTKRLKKLFQEWKVPPWLRESIPLVYFNDTLVAVVGYATNDLYCTHESLNSWSFLTIECDA